MGCGSSDSAAVIIDYRRYKSPEIVNEQKKQINTGAQYYNIYYNMNNMNNKNINNNYSNNNNYHNTNPYPNKLGTREKFDEFFTTEDKYYYIRTKKNLIIRFNKRLPNISLTFRVYNGENVEDKDIKCKVLTREDYIDIHYIFKHTGKYKTYLYAKDKDRNNPYECIANYEFECVEEWGDENFDFPI